MRIEAMPDDPNMIAILYGPIVLAGDLGKEGLTEAVRYGPNAPPVNRLPAVEVPVFLGEVKDVLGKVKPVLSAEGAGAASAAPLAFQTSGLGQPGDVRLIPLYKASDQRYTVYWKVYSPAELDKKKADEAAKAARRKEIERKTLDAVNISVEKSEIDHGFKGENATQGYFEGKRTREARNGWFSYDLKVAPNKPAVLVCTFVGSGGRPRLFDVLVDGEKIATPNLESAAYELVDFEYKLPAQLTRGKQQVTVKFQSQPDSGTGSVFDVRIIQ